MRAAKGRTDLTKVRTISRGRRWRHRFAIAGIGALALIAGAGAAVLATAYRLGPPAIQKASDLSEVVVDRKGRLLRAFTTDDGLWRLPVASGDVDRRYLKLLLAYEDRGFYRHLGVEPAALARAALQLFRYRRAVSGGSTLTMQVARLLDGKHDRSIATKWVQIVRALQLEAMLDKRQILDLYLRLAPFGGNLEGVRAAALAYFGKEPRRLSLGEAALLVALPQSPEARRPDRSHGAARAARDRVLIRAAAAGAITNSEARRAMAEGVPKKRLAFPKLAPHLAEDLVASSGVNRTVHHLTIDRDLQARLEALAHSGARALGKRLSVAILAADHRSGEILAQIGSADYFDANRLGAIDMIDAIRSPGSTLKPMIYGMAFEAGIAHPQTFIEDRPVRFGLYAPKNFDQDYKGTVTVAEALALSLNIPAVKVLDSVGPGRLVGRLRRAGLTLQLPDDSEPSLAVALGGVGMTLRQLTELYAGIANGGRSMALTITPKPAGNDSGHKTSAKPVARGTDNLLSPVAAWYVGDVLKGAPPPSAHRSGEIAYKTGTSYGYRDAWAIGFDGRHTVGVWVGRADATSTPGLTGRTAAAPILFDAFKRIAKERTAFKAAPTGALRVAGSDLPPPLKRFRESAEQVAVGPYIDPPVHIAFPPDRAEVAIDEPGAPVVLKASGGVLPLTWLIDDTPVGASRHERSIVWETKGRGFFKVSVIDAKGRVDRVVVRLR